MKIHLGCGNRLKDDWMNVDMLDIQAPNYMRHDLRNGMPVLPQQAEIVYSCHFWEHLSDEEGTRLLRAAHAALRPGGLFRMALPNFKTMVKAYVDDDWKFFDVLDWNAFSDRSTRSLIDVCSYGVYQFGEHKSIWDSAKAVKVLQRAGYSNCHEVPYNYGFEPQDEARERYTFVVEGTK